MGCSVCVGLVENLNNLCEEKLSWKTELPGYLVAVAPWWMLYSHGLIRQGRNFCGENTTKNLQKLSQEVVLLCCSAFFPFLLWLRDDGLSAEQAVTASVVYPAELTV